jgi:iron-sulfur cluster repair protein YtfE (RIC family)
MTTTPPDTQDLEQTLTTVPIRDLVEQYPEIMPILNDCGIDLCCGGGLTVPDAAEAHFHDASVIVYQMLRAIRGEGNE